jgi:hypothetical protein
MLVSCVCVCHNKPDLIPEAVQSILNQSHAQWEAFVIDSGVLYDSGYYDRFAWRRDPRIRLIRSQETAELRKTKAMAPWCFNECFRRGLVSGELVMYLCDDDLLYPNAFATFVRYAREHPEVQAMYASQDLAILWPNGWRSLVGERRATVPGGKCCGGRIMDCQVDYLQLCHRPEILNRFSHGEYWPESKETEGHADGIFMERIGELVPIQPIDVKVSQNRRTLRSLNDPIRPGPLMDCLANGAPLHLCRIPSRLFSSAEFPVAAGDPGNVRPVSNFSSCKERLDDPLVTLAIQDAANLALLKATLASLRNQTYERFEVLIMHPGPADWEEAVDLHKLRTQDPRFRTSSPTKDDPRGQINLAIALAQGAYFLPLKAGTIATRDALGRLVGAMLEHREISALACYTLMAQEAGSPKDGQTSPACGSKHLSSAGIFRTDDLRESKGRALPASLVEKEGQLFAELVNAGYQVDILPEHLFYCTEVPGEFPTRGATPIHPTAESTWHMQLDRILAGERVAIWKTMIDLHEQLRQVRAENADMRSQLRWLRYRIADRLSLACARVPGATKTLKKLIRWLHQAGTRFPRRPVWFVEPPAQDTSPHSALQGKEVEATR